MILFENRYQTFDTVFHHQTRWNTSKFVKNTPLHVVFSTLFSVFHLVMKHCISCLIYYLQYTRSVLNRQSTDTQLIWWSKHLTIKHKGYKGYIPYQLSYSWLVYIILYVTKKEKSKNHINYNSKPIHKGSHKLYF